MSDDTPGTPAANPGTPAAAPDTPATTAAGSPVWADIDLVALQENAATIAERLAPARLKCIVKANAYGHGVDIVARGLFDAGFREFGVATIAEALTLRDILGAEASIMAWLYGPSIDLEPALRARIEIGVSTVEGLFRVRAAAERIGTTARIHLKVDSGLGRNGFSPDGFATVLSRLMDLREVEDPHLEIVGIMSHFAVADEPERGETAEQSEMFDTVRGRLVEVLDAAEGRLGDPGSLEVHIANSPAALTLDPPPGTAARVGLALYGLSPLQDLEPSDLDLRPVMTVKSQIINLKDVPAGHGASYGLSYTAEKDTRFALVAGGYGDGIPRAASNRAEVVIRGKRYPVVGRIAMDQMIVDLGDGEAELGDEVVIFGAGGPSAAEWGAWSDTINYEIVTRISARVDRVASRPEVP